MAADVPFEKMPMQSSSESDKGKTPFNTKLRLNSESSSEKKYSFLSLEYCFRLVYKGLHKVTV